jgi:hypothetical protein
MTTFDLKRDDYDGDGVIEGVQTEVKGLLNKLALLLPPVGVAKDIIAIDKNWTRPQLKAGYNYLFVLEDGSYGVHNRAYAVGLLKASIADLTGDGNNDGLSDKWQNQYFGGTSNPDAAVGADPDKDGVVNSSEFAVGTDPTQADSDGDGIPDGVELKAGSDPLNVQDKPGDTIKIYTAAEVSFFTETGKTYQLQSVSSLGGGWQNVGSPVQGTGDVVTHLTSTRGDGQQFYRVVVTQ